MIRCHFPLACFAAATLQAPAPAQVVAGFIGHTVTGQLGTAGAFCWGFSCTPQALTVVSGETLTLTVRAPFSNFYAIGASFSATSCVTIPGIENQLALDAPIFMPALGTVNQQSPILACWSGFVNTALPLPAGLPSGLSFTTQAVAAVPTPTAFSGFAFSTPVTMTVQ